jgi:hypothetical protein
VKLHCESPGDLYPLRLPQHTAFTASSLPTMELWHQRLGHPGSNSLTQMLQTFDFNCNKSAFHSCHSARLVNMLDSPSGLPLIKHFSLFNFCTLMFGCRLFIAIPVTNITLFFLMIIHTIFGLFLSARNQTCFTLYAPSSHMCAPSLASLFLLCRLTTARNTTHLPCAASSPSREPSSGSPVRIPHSRTARPSAFSAR